MEARKSTHFADPTRCSRALFYAAVVEQEVKPYLTSDAGVIEENFFNMFVQQQRSHSQLIPTGHVDFRDFMIPSFHPSTHRNSAAFGVMRPVPFQRK